MFANNQWNFSFFPVGQHTQNLIFSIWIIFESSLHAQKRKNGRRMAGRLCSFANPVGQARSGKIFRTVDTRSFTWLIDSSISLRSSGWNFTSTTFSMPAEPSTQGTPTK